MNLREKLFILLIVMMFFMLCLVIIFNDKKTNFKVSADYKSYNKDNFPISSGQSTSKSKDNISEIVSFAAKKGLPCVAHIFIDKKENPGTFHSGLGRNTYLSIQKNTITLGSGIIVSQDGYIITNNHVVENFPGRIKVGINKGKIYNAEIVGKDKYTDLAVIRINARNFPYIKFGDSEKVEEGDIVLALGNPFGIGETVTMGIISAKGRKDLGISGYENFLQTDAAINSGNSGGALVNLKGELIGINTAILTKSGGYEGISFAIPSNMAKKVFMEILSKGKVEKAWLGIGVQNLNDELAKKINLNISSGVIVVDVIAGSPAQKAGIEKGDIIFSVNGLQLHNKLHFKTIIAESNTGIYAVLQVYRNKKQKKITVKISRLPDNMNYFDVKNVKILRGFLKSSSVIILPDFLG